MCLSDALRVLTAQTLLPIIAGCADLGYRERSKLVHTRYATVQSFGDEEITVEQVDDLLEEVADVLKVTLTPDTPKVRIMVMPADRIATIERQLVTIAPHGADARALYLPGASVVAIPYYSRRLLGHELAHYLTDHHLKSTPRRSWERIALMVEDALPGAPRLQARRQPAPDALASRTALVPLLAPAN
jgi:Zn-dependent protease with chaperone function